MNIVHSVCRTSWVLAAALAVAPALAQTPIAIANSSFEQDPFSGGFVVSNTVAGWTALGEPGARGLLAPDAPEADRFYPGATPGYHGRAVEFHWNGSSGVEQLLGERLRANTRYTLTVASGTRSSQDGPFAGYDIRLQTETGVPVGSWFGASRNLAALGTFADTSRSFETGPNPAGLGQRLRIQLRAGSTGYADLDNVRLTATPVAARAALVPIDVFIVSGQSNAQGWKANSATLNAANRHYADAPDPRALLGYRERLLGDTVDSVGSIGQLDTQGSGFGGNFDGFGPELSLGSDYAVGAAKPVAIIKYAVGSAGLAQNYAKTGASGEALYPSLIQHIRAVLAELSSQGYQPNLQAMFWLQGETDALFGTSATYGANINRFIADVRGDVGAPNLRFYLTQINPNMPQFANAQPQVKNVNDGMTAAAQSDPQRVFYVRTDDIQTGFADAIHYSADQTVEIGRRWAASYLSNP